MLDKFKEFLFSHELQFGFKTSVGCSDAVFVVQNVIEYFIKRNSTVFLASVDASKAFDKIVHVQLFDKYWSVKCRYVLLNLLKTGTQNVMPCLVGWLLKSVV